MRHILRTAALATALAASLSAQTTYHVTRTTRTGGEGFWDYLVADTTSGRVFLSRGTHVQVFDLAADSVVGDIANTMGVHGVALVPAMNKGFTSNGRDSSLTVFDYHTLAPTAVIHIAGVNPDAILYEPTSRRVFTFNGRSQDATAIDAASNAVVGTIPLGGKPEAANWDGKGNVFVNIEDDSGKVVEFNAATLAKEAEWDVAGCSSPSGQGIDRAHTLLFLACENGVMAVVNYSTGATVTRIASGEGADGAVFDPASQLAFVTNGRSATLTVVHEDSPTHFTLLGNAPTRLGARTITLDERTHAIYTVTAEFGPMPAATPAQPRPRPSMVPGSFMLIELRP